MAGGVCQQKEMNMSLTYMLYKFIYVNRILSKYQVCYFLDVLFISMSMLSKPQDIVFALYSSKLGKMVS